MNIGVHVSLSILVSSVLSTLLNIPLLFLVELMLKLLCTASIVVDFAGFQSLIALGAPRIHRVLSMLNLLSTNFLLFSY